MKQLFAYLEQARPKAERDWLTARRVQMEAKLVALGVPADTWRALRLRTPYPEQLANPDETCLTGGETPQRVLWVNPRVLWTAAIALVCAEATEKRGPEYRLMLGRLLERFERWRAHPNERSQAAQAELSRRGQLGGAAGRDRVKRSHTSLFRRAADLLEEHGQRATPARVRAVLKTAWQKLAHDVGDPLGDIVNVNVRGSVIDVEYTKQWAQRLGRRNQFVEVREEALKKALKRRALAR